MHHSNMSFEVNFSLSPVRAIGAYKLRILATFILAMTIIR